MMRLAFLAALLLVPFASLPAVSAALPSCADVTVDPVETVQAPAGGTYYVAPQEDGRALFQESNGYPGLQVVACLDGSIERAADRSMTDPPSLPPLPPLPQCVYIGGQYICLF